jgi:hypothetical protein
MASRIGGADPLLLESIESILGEPQKVCPCDLQVMRLNDGVIDVVGKQFEPNVFLEGGTGVANEAPLPGNRFDDVLALELRVRFGDGVAIDAQVFGNEPDRRQRISCFESAGSQSGFGLIDELEVDGLS